MNRKYFKNQLEVRLHDIVYYGVEVDGEWSYKSMPSDDIEVVLKDYEYVATVIPDGIPLFRKSNPHDDYDRAMGVI